ncbi:MAG TPA: PQQ-dependent sugar dehydrogenase [Labilithrix sp.]|nr:PQQ-dependent sugar dehydrogenase [Labilithrix sp.]
MSPSRVSHWGGLIVVVATACVGDSDARSTGLDPKLGVQEASPDERPTGCFAHARPPASTAVSLEPVFANAKLKAPMMMAQIPGDGSRWFVAERGTTNGEAARIVSFPASTPFEAETVVATVGPLQYVTDGEGGMLGLAFHPNFAQNGRLYVTWVTSGSNGVARSAVGYLTSADGGLSFAGYSEILSFDQPASPHKGGGIAFGKDGYLYLSFGDGAYPADVMGVAQRRDGMFGKVLRIDVDNVPLGTTYGIPPDNPFHDGGGEPATFAWGFRNPVRLSVDRGTGDVWVGDVGDAHREEINLVLGGQNYGWPCREGTLDLLVNDSLRCPSTVGLTPPVLEQAHDGKSRSITGGVVYRGKAIPDLVGKYVFGDFVTQEIFGLETATQTVTTFNPSGPTGMWISFAEDQDGEVYALSFSGHAIYKLVPTPAADGMASFPNRLSLTGCVDPNDPKKPAPGFVNYGVNAELWSDGATKDRWFAIPDGTRIGVDADGDLELPIGSVAMKTFKLDGRLVETRLLMHHADGDWGGYAYAWNDDGTDAVLASGPKTFGDRVWTLPTQSECLRCHTTAAKRTLGLELRQLDRDFPSLDGTPTANQIDWLTSVGMLDLAPDTPRDPLPNPLGDGPLDKRARAWLHVNCSSCHRPGGGGRGAADLRYSMSLHDARVCNQLGEAQIGSAKWLLAAGSPELSLLATRPREPPGYFRMPPIGTTVVDEAGVGVLDAWIRDQTDCP